MSKREKNNTTASTAASPKKTRLEPDVATVDEAPPSNPQRDRVIKKLEKWRYDWEEHANYSGRGMYGAKSPFAVVVAEQPSSKLGQKLRGLGMSSDNMAFKYIYYFE